MVAKDPLPVLPPIGRRGGRSAIAPLCLREGNDLPAELGEVPIEGERGPEAEPLHDGEAERVGQRKVLVGVLKEDRLGAGLVPLPHPDDRLAGPKVEEGVQGDLAPEPIEEEAMELEEDGVRRGQPTTLGNQPRNRRRGRRVTDVMPVDGRKVGGAIDEDAAVGRG